MKFLYSLILLILLVSCSGNSVDDKNCRFLLDLNILPIEINLQLPEYLNLNSTGNSFYIANAGNGGIIITNIGFEYKAWDAADPNYIPNTCLPLVPSGLEATSNCGEGNKYSLVTGQALGNTSLRCALKNYSVQQTGNTLLIFN